MFNLYALPQIFTSILMLALGLFVFYKNRNSALNFSFFIMLFIACVWLLGVSMVILSTKEVSAIFWAKITFSAVTLIPVGVYSFTTIFLNLKRERLFLNIAIALGFFMVFLISSSDLLVSGVRKYFWGYYAIGKLGAVLTAVIYLVFFNRSLYLLFKAYKKTKIESPIVHDRIKYILLALFITIFASVDFLPMFGIEVYPFGSLFMVGFLSIVAYAIVRHRFMDISLAITRTGVFIIVYSVVLGLPFILAFNLKKQLVSWLGDNWWIIPLSSSTILATVGPFIYFYIEKKAEEKIFEEQRRYQNTLRQASSGMGRIKDLDRLVNLIVHIVTRTVHLEHALVYLNESQGEQYSLRSSRSADIRFKPITHIDRDSPLIQYLLDSKSPVVYEEIKQRTEDYGNLNLARLESAMKILNAALVVPSFVEDRLLAIIILGKKTSGSLYTEDDLNVFSILANQAALAIENAQFYEDVKKTHEQLFKAEKMATIGTMADGLSHQINNRLHALGFIASDVLDTIKLKKNLPMTPELKEMLVDIEHGLTRIQENVTQGGEIVRGLLKYTRKGEEGFAAVDLNQLLDSAVEMTQFKIKPGELTILREFGRDVPKIKGNFTQLQEVFFNLIDNAFDAMMQRKNEFKEPDYEATIKISTENSDDGHLKIIVVDNGIGIKDDDKNKLFTPFFTTKLSSKKGTGLGLYVIRKLIEENHTGKVAYDSKYKQGTRVILSLPIYTNA